MSTRNRYAVAIGVLIAIGAGGVTVAAFYAKTPRGSDPTIALSIRPAAAVPGMSAPAPAAVPSTTVLATTPASKQDTITVVGSGTATGVPDEAILGLGVQATEPNVHAALSVAAADMSRLLSALHHQGVADKDIQTSSISISQQTDCCPQSVNGYVSSNSVTVTVHHLANVSPVIEAVVAAVGNDIQLDGVTLSISNPSPLVKAARAAAMSDANARAQVWAGLAHHHVGGIIELSEIVSAPPAYACNNCGMGGAGGVPIQPGQMPVTVTITAVYELVA
jgi:Uncharacterized conserved protein